jgi:hypothetical protein
VPPLARVNILASVRHQHAAAPGPIVKINDLFGIRLTAAVHAAHRSRRNNKGARVVSAKRKLLAICLALVLTWIAILIWLFVKIVFY